MAMDTDQEQPDRVRRHTEPATTAEIDKTIRRNVEEHATRPFEWSPRIGELEREWDVERTLEANASTLALVGASLGTAGWRRWFALPIVVLSFLIQHATSGWCPPLPILRRLGVRTRGEIDREKFALKALRGDFRDEAGSRPSVEKALQAVMSAESAGLDGGREPDRVRRYTSREQLRRIDDSMEKRVRLYASQPGEVIGERIEELRREWSIERYLQINVAAVGLSTTALALGVNRRWGIVTCAGLAFFLFHAVEGFDPPLPALRRAGVRSRAEINRELYALKILRGDFDAVFAADDDSTRLQAVLRAVET